jgi:hypothetical protein
MPSCTLQIVDSNTEKPIEGASVSGGVASGTSNGQGLLSCTFAEEDQVETLSAPGYQSVQIYLQETLGGYLSESLTKTSSSTATGPTWG